MCVNCAFYCILYTNTGQWAWWRMKSLTLPRMVLLITPIPLLPVTINLAFSLSAISMMPCDGFSAFSNLTSAWTLRIIMDEHLNFQMNIYTCYKHRHRTHRKEQHFNCIPHLLTIKINIDALCLWRTITSPITRYIDLRFQVSIMHVHQSYLRLPCVIASNAQYPF